ncbi:MAG TPA: VWA domain-containing protein [Vicinamibacterales bacterium]|nr:VWA domain-containing protein [Vicinamibacterales bacterium]
MLPVRFCLASLAVIFYSGGPFPPVLLRGAPSAPLRIFYSGGPFPSVLLRGAPSAPLRIGLAPQAPQGSQGSQGPTFSAGNRTVAVYATVTERSGRLVPDLDRNQFEVADNGKRQELTLFANDTQPITIVMLLDRSSSMHANFARVEAAAEEFVREMLPGDKARIGSFSNRIQVDPEDFTSNHSDLIAILQRDLQEEGPTPLWNAVNYGISALRHEQGRRVILVFTDGVDSPMNFSKNNSSLKSVMKRAEEENVMVYAIGFSGDNSPTGGGHSGGRSQSPFGRGGFGGGGFGRGGFGGGGAAFTEGPDPGLKDISAATGGGYFELTSTVDIASTFKRVASELHNQYALGFTPAALDGKLHSLTVRVKDTSMTVRARRSYLAEKPRT